MQLVRQALHHWAHAQVPAPLPARSPPSSRQSAVGISAHTLYELHLKKPKV